MKKIIVLMTAVLCVASLLAGCGGTPERYNAGTYMATAEGYAGDVTVEVEFDKASILSVKVTNHNETVGFGDRAADELPGKIVEAQTWEVDAITSATVTSDAIKAAVKDCISQAEKAE